MPRDAGAWTRLDTLHAPYPPDGQDVLVYCGERSYDVAFCETDIDGTKWFDWTGEMSDVEAWMPLPAPPTEPRRE